MVEVRPGTATRAYWSDAATALSGDKALASKVPVAEINKG